MDYQNLSRHICSWFIMELKFKLLKLLVKSGVIQIKMIHEQLNYWVMERKRSCGFHRIFTVAFERLFQVKLGYVNVNDCSAGLEPPAVARNRRKSTVKIGRNPPLSLLKKFQHCLLSYLKKPFKIKILKSNVFQRSKIHKYNIMLFVIKVA